MSSRGHNNSELVIIDLGNDVRLIEFPNYFNASHDIKALHCADC